MISLTTEQQTQARLWIADGMKLSDFQKRIETDFKIVMTYMEVRFLLDDLKVTPKDPEPPKEAVVATPPVAGPESALSPDEVIPAPRTSTVSVTVDAVTRPGAMVSGRVVFSDSKGAAWMLDQYGRSRLIADEKNYRPSPADLAEFQVLLEQELAKHGF
ncbi:MAG: hypothetical protein EXS25_10295 [Pedosphaera sp.]|nr:hypothetical protein [Pedosphaera sp.]